MDFDEEDALTRTVGDRNLLGQVIRFTLEDLPPMMELAKQAVDEGNDADISKIAHKIKGSAGACGARRLYLAALELELAGKDRTGDYLRYLEDVESAFETFVSLPNVREFASLDDEPDASIG